MVEPMVLECLVERCSFNGGKKCHAFGITVGDGEHPMCDTYAALKTKGGTANVIGRIGACKVVKCRFNIALGCTASDVRVKYHGEHPDCGTFEAGW